MSHPLAFSASAFDSIEAGVPFSTQASTALIPPLALETLTNSTNHPSSLATIANSAAASFSQSVSLGTTVDFNGDGRADFLRQERDYWDDDSIFTVHVFISTGNGSFTRYLLPETLYLQSDLANLYLGDFNGDRCTDILRQEKGIWDDDNFNTANIFFSNGNGTFNQVNLSETLGIKGDLTNLYLGDFDGNGRTDILRQEKSIADDDAISTASILLSNGNGTFTQTNLPEDFFLKGDFTNLYLGDFNGDGQTDVLRQEKGIWDNDDVNTANVFLSIGNGTFRLENLANELSTVLKGDLTNLYLGDFNGDGCTDFLRQEKGIWDNDDFNTANVYLSNGYGGFQLGNLSTNLANLLKGDLTNLYLGDFDGDGRTDFLRQEKGIWDNDDFNTANVYLSNGNGSFRLGTLPSTIASILKGDLTNLYIADFNGDARADILRQEKDVWGNDQINTANVFLTNSNGTFSQINLDEAFSLKGDFTNLYVGQNTLDRTSTTRQRLQGTLGADTFRLNPDAILTVISGNGNVDFGDGRRDVLDLTDVVSSLVSLNLYGRNGGTGVTYAAEVGNNRIFDAIHFLDGRQVLLEGVEQIRFADIVINLSVVPTDPLFNQQWNLHMTGVHNAWRITQGNDRVLLGVQDGGVAINLPNFVHPDLGAGDTIYVGNSADDTVPSPTGQSAFSHGTAVHGIIGAATDDNRGMSGINWNSRVVQVDVLGGEAGDQDLAAATRTMLNSRQPGQKLVINFSLTYGISSEFEQLVANHQDDVLFVISSANNGNAGVGLADPASLATRLDNVLAVGAAWGRRDRFGNSTNPGDRIEYFDSWASQYGQGLTLLAPSEVITTTATRTTATEAWTFDYARDFNGTSAAAPHVAGIASLVWSANPNLSAVQLKVLLSETAVDLNTRGYDIYTGHGLVNADAAVRRAIAMA